MNKNDYYDQLPLTKREQFAVTILAGLLAGRAIVHTNSDDVQKAVNLADKLIKELDKGKN